MSLQTGKISMRIDLFRYHHHHHCSAVVIHSRIKACPKHFQLFLTSSAFIQSVPVFFQSSVQRIGGLPPFFLSSYGHHCRSIFVPSNMAFIPATCWSSSVTFVFSLIITLGTLSPNLISSIASPFLDNRRKIRTITINNIFKLTFRHFRIYFSFAIRVSSAKILLIVTVYLFIRQQNLPSYNSVLLFSNRY